VGAHVITEVEFNCTTATRGAHHDSAHCLEGFVYNIRFISSVIIRSY